MSPIAPLLWAVAGGAFAASGWRALLDGQWLIGGVFLAVGCLLGAVAAWCQRCVTGSR